MTEKPLKDFKKRKAQSRIVDVHMDTLKNLLALPNQKSFAGLRDFALIMFTLDAVSPTKRSVITQASEFQFST